jgi:hypothetical protein
MTTLALGLVVGRRQEMQTIRLRRRTKTRETMADAFIVEVKVSRKWTETVLVLEEGGSVTLPVFRCNKNKERVSMPRRDFLSSGHKKN